MRKSIPMLCLLLCAGVVQAEVYRCQGAFGEPEFSQQPCPGGTAVPLNAGPRASGPATGLRPAERAWLDARATDRKRRGPSGKVRRGGDAKDTRRQAYRCRDKRRALDTVKSRLRRGYKPAQGERLRRRRQAYEDYLSTFCS